MHLQALHAFVFNQSKEIIICEHENHDKLFISGFFFFKYNPHSELLFTNRGLILQLMGDKASAMKDYQKAISLNPKYALAHFNAATLFFYNGQFEQVKLVPILTLFCRKYPLMSLFFCDTGTRVLQQSF